MEKEKIDWDFVFYVFFIIYFCVFEAVWLVYNIYTGGTLLSVLLLLTFPIGITVILYDTGN